MYQLPMPDFLADIYAKSQDRGGETLAEHTGDVLAMLARLRDLRPDLPALTQMPRLWRTLFWACLFHDFGKAAHGFQQMLQTKERWDERHEVLSLIAFHWIAQNFSEDEQRAIVAAIASHHRDDMYIREKYADVDPDPLMKLVPELNAGLLQRLWQWVDQFATPWARLLGFATSGEPLMELLPQDEAVASVLRDGSRQMRLWLKLYQKWVSDLRDSPQHNQRILATLLRGLTTTADHLASAHVTHLEPPVREDWQHLADRILAKDDEDGSAKQLIHKHVYAHQRASSTHNGWSALLVAPTGSGKTEAALFWALGEGTRPVPRLFYALPYQASMNAMYDRLRDTEKGFGDKAIGLQHGRAAQALYARMMDDETTPLQAQARIARERDISAMHARPVTVFSPYQMLKALFQIRGYEAMFTDYAQAAFIFDEIHAYEPSRLALILTLIKHLRIQYGARFFVMSATFPTIIRERLMAALGINDSDVISASDALYAKFQRHRLKLLDGDLMGEGIERALSDYQAGKSVLVCANTIQRAQDAYRILKAQLPVEEKAKPPVTLIHGRFATQDRSILERDIIERCKVGGTGEPLILVATQVVEVSLNIDLDTMYSDPAPLDALLQRFGRINRQGTKGVCPVHVFQRPDDGQGVYGKSRDPEKRGHIVRVTLEVLRQHDDTDIDEAQTEKWLDRIYGDELVSKEWVEEYQSMETIAKQVLGGLAAFNSDQRTEEEFEKLFDGVDVLPSYYEKDYLDAIAEERYVDASGFFVNVSSRMHKILAQKGQLLPCVAMDNEKRKKPWLVKRPYSPLTGLNLDKADGLPDEE
ncbi:MAG: CRISPR-associated helicase Cas3' [Ktedonobacterales bacterium]